MRRVELGSGDSALVLRENGEVEFVIPTREGNEKVPDDEVVLIGLAMAFNDPRLRELIYEVWEETRVLADAKPGPATPRMN